MQTETENVGSVSQGSLFSIRTNGFSRGWVVNLILIALAATQYNVEYIYGKRHIDDPNYTHKSPTAYNRWGGIFFAGTGSAV